MALKEKKEEVKKPRSSEQLKEAYPNIGQEEDRDWRLLTQQAKRDIPPATQKRMQDIAAYLYDSNPVGHRIPEIMKDFVVGDGFSFAAPNPKVMKILEEFWHDKDTNWEDEQDRSVLELSLFGEQCYPVFINKHDGHVKMSYIDPGLIYSVKLDRNNPKFVKSIIWQPTLAADKREIDVIHPERNRRKKNYGRMVGKDKDKLQVRYPDGCFYFRINNVTLASRGRSDLLCVSDWIDGYDQFLFARLERAFLLNNFVWDILCKGMSRAEIEEFSKDFKPPRPGSMRFHNENVEWAAVAPNLQAGDATQEAGLFKTQILGGKGFPAHWFSEGEKTTRACYSEDTETLTENGWKKYWEVLKDEKLATFNPEKDRIEFCKPKGKIYLYDYEGEMYHFTNERTDILVTPEHKMWLRSKSTKKWKKVKAKDITLSSFYFREGAKNWKGLIQKYFDLPYVAYEAQSRKKDMPRKIKMTDWVKFLGWYLSEGYLHKVKLGKSFQIRIAQKDSRNIKEIRQVLRNLGFEFNEGDNGIGVTVFGLNNKSLFYYLKEKIGCISGEKRIPKEILQLDRSYLKILFDSIMKGDGHWDKREGRKSFSYATKSDQLADDFQVLCLLLGYSSRKGKSYKDRFSWFTVTGSEKIERNLRTKNFVNNHGISYKSNIQTKKYKGKVYCFEVPNQLFITRRNGKIAIHSNTAQEMGLPTLKMLKSRQRYHKFMFKSIFQFVIDQAVIHGELDENEDLSFRVIVSPIAEKDTRGAAISLDKFTTSLVAAADKNWITDDAAAKAYKTFVSQLGIEIANDQEEEETKEKKDEDTEEEE